MTSILAVPNCFGRTTNGCELSGISKLTDMNNNSETPSVSGMIRPLMDIADRKLLHIGAILGPIPNLFKWLQNELNRVEKTLQNSLVMMNNRTNQSQTLVELALTKEEQNMEIVLINEQYYFEVIRSFRVQQKSANHDHYSVGTPLIGSDSKTDFGEKPKAWFCREIEERISPIRPAQTWLNGKELFCCLVCNHFSFYSNHSMLHMMFDCPKKPQSQQNLSDDHGSLRSTNDEQQQQHPIESLTKAKMLTNQIMDDFNQNHNSKNQKQIRSFDIMSLLNNGKNEDKDDEEVDVETLDSNEETIQTTLKVLNHNAHPLKQNTKRQMDSKLQHHQQHNLYHQTILIGSEQSKECLPPPPPPSLQSSSSMKKFNGNSRKYSNKCGKISKSFNSPTSSGGNTNKSAFKKFRNNKNIKTSNKLNPQQQMFISNQANLANFHNQFSSPPTHTNGAATNPLFSFANLFRNTHPNVTSQNRISNISSPNSSTESIPLIAQLYPLIASNTNSHNHLAANGQLCQNKLLAVSPDDAQQQPSTSNLFESNTSNITVRTMDPSSSVKTIGDISLESNSPTLSESSGSLISLPNSPAYTASNYSANNNHSDDQNIIKSNNEKIAHDSEPSSMIQLLPQSAQSTMANNPLFNLPPYFMPPTSTAASNPLITSLYLLSPSLTALSYQASNVCAYCNTAFRMTSDLVYHMRSHHKRTKSNDDQVNKKRRDDQLRCHICNETFRERHHLTRHMTSHQ